MSLAYMVIYGYLAETSDQIYKEWTKKEYFTEDDQLKAQERFVILKKVRPTHQQENVNIPANFLHLHLVQGADNLVVRTIQTHIFSDAKEATNKQSSDSVSIPGVWVVTAYDLNTTERSVIGVASTPEGTALLWNSVIPEMPLLRRVISSSYHVLVENQIKN